MISQRSDFHLLSSTSGVRKINMIAWVVVKGDERYQWAIITLL